MKKLNRKEMEACGSGAWLARIYKKFGRISRRLGGWEMAQ